MSRNTHLPRRTVLAALSLALLAPLFGHAASSIDLSPEQKGQPKGRPVPEAIKLLSKDVRFVKDKTFVVAIAGGILPIGGFASDSKTIIGADPDISRLVADGLGRKLELVNVAWADWPLGLQSGKYDAVISNVTVTEARKEKFDFSTYRKDLLGFYTKAGSKLKINEPKDTAGLKVIVGAGTNQEQILLEWNKKNEAAGLKPLQALYFDDEAVARVALQSGRTDAWLGPNAIYALEAARTGKVRLAGTFSGGWPLTADIAVTTRKDSGLAPAITKIINTQIANGNYAKVLSRWGLSAEAVSESRTNPPGLPKS
ncbi:ABC transporter substrate-binding protein [Aquitalea sp. USM4]|nr:ABC transporter substrate-binding protein [Aquitalea sp. USM4]